MATTFDSTTFAVVVAKARQDAAQHPRWLNAIDRAARELAENPWIAQQGDHLLIGSPSGQVYAANGVCQCLAYQNQRPCWHRAAARLIQRYDEAVREQQTRALADKAAAYRKALAEINELFA